MTKLLTRQYIDYPALPKGYSWRTTVDNSHPLKRTITVTLLKDIRIFGIVVSTKIASEEGDIKRSRNSDLYLIERVSAALATLMLKKYLGARD